MEDFAPKNRVLKSKLPKPRPPKLAAKNRELPVTTPKNALAAQKPAVARLPFALCEQTRSPRLFERCGRNLSACPHIENRSNLTPNLISDLAPNSNPTPDLTPTTDRAFGALCHHRLGKAADPVPRAPGVAPTPPGRWSQRKDHRFHPHPPIRRPRPPGFPCSPKPGPAEAASPQPTQTPFSERLLTPAAPARISGKKRAAK